jgi:hypothetical protein
MCWAVLDLIISGARGLGLTDLDHQQLLRQRQGEDHPAEMIA